MSFHQMQALVALVLVLNVLDTVTTWYGIAHGLAKEGNGIVDRAMRFVGMSGWGLVCVKLPGFVQALLALLPQLFARVVPNAALVWCADVPDYAWYASAALYSVVVANNVRICWGHSLARIEQDMKEWL